METEPARIGSPRTPGTSPAGRLPGHSSRPSGITPGAAAQQKPAGYAWSPQGMVLREENGNVHGAQYCIDRGFLGDD